MKKIVLLLTVIIAMVSCGDKSDDVKKQTWDPNATVLIRAAEGVKPRSANEHLTALEIVQQTYNMGFKSHYGSNIYKEDVAVLNRGFSDPQRDYNIPALKMWGSDIINDGAIYREFLKGFDFVLTTKENDTIAYIPNQVLRSAEAGIINAYEREDYEAVYGLFNTAFTFTPITGAEYRQLKAENKQ